MNGAAVLGTYVRDYARHWQVEAAKWHRSIESGAIGADYLKYAQAMRHAAYAKARWCMGVAA